MALPGVRTTILDRFYNLGRTDLPGGPTVALVAKRDTANGTNGVNDLQPYFVAGEKDVIEAFGEGSYIHRAYYEASVAGASSIVCIALPSDTVFNHSTGAVTSGGNSVFDEIFDVAENIRADIIVPWGAGTDSDTWDDYAEPATPAPQASDFFYADNSTNTAVSWVKKVADKCAQITADSHPCFAVMGVKGVPGTEEPTTTQVTAGIALPALVDKDAITNGHFVSVVATEIRPLSYPSSWGWANGATHYAAAASRLEAWRAVTGKPVYNVDRLRYKLSRNHIETLNNKGVVVTSQDFSRTLKWVDATTFAASSSDFSRLTTLRVAFDTVKVILSVSENYKGEAMSLAAQNAFETQIGSRLRSMQQVGAILNSDFRVTYVPSANQALIDLAITPAFELREIILTLSINF